MFLLPDDDLPELSPKLLLCLLCLCLEGVDLIPAVHPQLQTPFISLHYTGHAQGRGGKGELEMVGLVGSALVPRTRVAGVCAVDGFAEHDVVVVEKDLTALASVAEEQLALAFVLTRYLRRENKHIISYYEFGHFMYIDLHIQYTGVIEIEAYRFRLDKGEYVISMLLIECTINSGLLLIRGYVLYSTYIVQHYIISRSI